MKKILYLMRHGQTLFNLQHKIQGWCDAPLTPLGIKQAQMAKNTLQILLLITLMLLLLKEHRIL